VKHKTKKEVSFFRIFVILGIIALLFTLGLKLAGRYAFQYPCANSISCAKDLTGLYDIKSISAEFHGKAVSVPPQQGTRNLLSSVLGEAAPSQKRIYVDLSKQRLYAFEGTKLVYSFLVSTGLWGRTPTGDFRIWIKLRYTRMTGGNAAIGTYYNLPNVPYVMFFYNDTVPKQSGYSLHGTYWHNNFGHPMSHGCVNMKTEEVALLYAWANPVTQGNITYATKEDPGTLITIYGTAPVE
jgi:lipoprotein-anchoring transpeptidase ErfK/SrfK